MITHEAGNDILVGDLALTSSISPHLEPPMVFPVFMAAALSSSMAWAA
jgi:hypothetical protein